jgi:hypothetical protein
MSPIRPTLIIGCMALLLASHSVLASPPQGKPGKPEQHHGVEQRGQQHGPSIDERLIRRILLDNRQLLGAPQGLPPGIAKNLARGKPLPPGIAKNFDNRLLGKLPRYDGYEWKQVGRDIVLVTATGVIYEILRNVLD